MDAQIGTRRPTMLRVSPLWAAALMLGALGAMSWPLAAAAAPAEDESVAETETAVLTQVDPLAGALALAGLLVALSLVFLLARRLFKAS